jgi:hypothetical protein
MTKEIDKLLATLPLRRRLEAARYDAELRQRPVESWEMVEATKRLLKGVELTEREADELHALVRQNTRRGRR